MNPQWLDLCATNSITKEEYAQVIEHLRAGRKAAAELSSIKRAQAGKRKRKKAVEPQEPAE
mgnify:FL=1